MNHRLGALVLFASDLDRTVAFYRLLGFPLKVDDHGESAGPLHYACELEGCHFAIFPKIARVVAARKLLTLVFYGLRDGEIRCLTGPGGGGVRLGHGPAASSHDRHDPTPSAGRSM